MQGIDVSKWNGSNDFNRAKADGVEFVIIRSNYGYNDNFELQGYDEYFEENYSRAKKEGLPIGIYCYNYSQTIAQAEAEAKRTLKCLKGKTVDIAVFADAEDKYFLQGDNPTQKVIAYLKIIKSAGYKIGVYANANWFNNYLDLEKIKRELGEVITWIAHYNSGIYNANPNYYKGRYDIWQYGSEGYYVDGVSNFGGGIGYVDTNISYIDFAKKESEEYMEQISERYMLNGNYSIDSLPWWCSDKKNIGSTLDYTGYVVTVSRKWGNYWYSQFLGGWIDYKAFTKVDILDEIRTVVDGGYSVDTLPWGTPGYKTVMRAEELKGKSLRITAKKGAYYYIHELAKWIDEKAFGSPKKKTIEEIAKEVLEGKWGNYPERKTLLEKAGYNYEEVQSKVEELA